MSSKARKELKIGGGTSPHRQLFTPSTPVRTSHTTQGRAKDGEKNFNESTVNIPQSLQSFFLRIWSAWQGWKGQRKTLWWWCNQCLALPGSAISAPNWLSNTGCAIPMRKDTLHLVVPNISKFYSREFIKCKDGAVYPIQKRTHLATLPESA